MGSDISGTVDKIGGKVTEWSVGDRVAGFNQGGKFSLKSKLTDQVSNACAPATSGNPRPGSFAEFAILEADLAIRIPSAVSFEEAATLPLCSLTAAQVSFI